VTDLARFMSALFAAGIGERDRVVSRETLEEMLTPQFAPRGATTGYGIGFGLSELDGHRSVGHGGAIYGFATDLAALPDEKIGAVAVTTMDGANTVVDRITKYALRLMLAVREQRPLPDVETTQPVPEELVEQLAGRYGSGDQQVDITTRGGEVHAWVRRPGLRLRVRALNDTLVIDDRLGYGARVFPTEVGILFNGDPLERVARQVPNKVPETWRGLIGEYGWDHNVLYILEMDRQLHALIEWFFLYPLEEVAPDVFAFPPWGLYDGEQLRFSRDDTGRATRVEAASVMFTRREVGTEAGVTFTIEPVRAVNELRREALAAPPPNETGEFRDPDLIELQTLDPTISYDIRYATTNNFMQSVFYDEAKAFLQRPAAEALVRAHRSLRQQGYGLLIHDAYRPWYVTKMFWDATPEDKKIFVANPASGSRHNRGAAVDLTLYDLRTGQSVEMVGGYDEFSDRSFPGYVGGTSLQRWHRDLLREVMEAEGFRVYEFEWWHFDHGDWSQYPIMNQTFGEIIEN
jgi:D-alanyl-D-alanine dipeptidase